MVWLAEKHLIGEIKNKKIKNVRVKGKGTKPYHNIIMPHAREWAQAYTIRSKTKSVASHALEVTRIT